MQTQHPSLKFAANITLVLLVIMLIGSVIYNKESMLFSDCAHNLFRIINHNHTEVEASRYGIAISQAFPLMAARLHMPLRMIMMMYAASFYIFYLMVVLLLIYVFKAYEFAILFGFYVTLLVSDSYYYLNNEGIALLLLAYAFLFAIARKKIPFFLSLLLFIPPVYLALWTHPLVMFAAIYLWFFLMTDKAIWPYTPVQTIILTIMLLALSYRKFYEGLHHGYDSMRIDSITHFELKNIFIIYKSPQFRFLLKSFITNYWICSLLFITGIVALLRERKYWLCFLTVSFVLAYFVLCCITFWDNDHMRFYLEIEYMTLSVVMSAPFVYYVLPKINWKSSTILIALIYSIRLLYMHHSATLLADRLALLEQICAKVKDKHLTKVIITNQPVSISNALILTWGAPAESMLYSRLDGESPQRTFIFADAGEIPSANHGGRDTLIGCWEMWYPQKLNSFYFRIDTTTTYQVMDYEQLMR